MARDNTASPIPVVLGIDVEPDDFFIDRNRPRPWHGFEFSQGYLRELRARCEEATGQPAHFYWSLRMDPQVATAYGSATWVADQYAEQLAEFRAAGDELGIHVHTYRWSHSRDAWLDDCGNPDWVAECLQSSAEHFVRVFGEPARTLRFGNFWLSTAAVNQAEDLGIEYDLTIEPGLRSMTKSGNKPPMSGPTPSFWRVPRAPYRPSRQDFTTPAAGSEARSIVMLPLTSAYCQLDWSMKGWRHRLGRLRRNGLQGRLQSLPLSMWRTWNAPDTYSAMLDRALTVQKQPYLAFAIRSDINGKNFAAYDSSLQALIAHPAISKFRFCTPRAALELLPPA